MSNYHRQESLSYKTYLKFKDTILNKIERVKDNVRVLNQDVRLIKEFLKSGPHSSAYEIFLDKKSKE